MASTDILHGGRTGITYRDGGWEKDGRRNSGGPYPRDLGPLGREAGLPAARAGNGSLARPSRQPFRSAFLAQLPGEVPEIYQRRVADRANAGALLAKLRFTGLVETDRGWTVKGEAPRFPGEGAPQWREPLVFATSYDVYKYFPDEKPKLPTDREAQSRLSKVASKARGMGYSSVRIEGTGSRARVSAAQRRPLGDYVFREFRSESELVR